MENLDIFNDLSPSFDDAESDLEEFGKLNLENPSEKDLKRLEEELCDLSMEWECNKRELNQVTMLRSHLRGKSEKMEVQIEQLRKVEKVEQISLRNVVSDEIPKINKKMNKSMQMAEDTITDMKNVIYGEISTKKVDKFFSFNRFAKLKDVDKEFSESLRQLIYKEFPPDINKSASVGTESQYELFALNKEVVQKAKKLEQFGTFKMEMKRLEETAAKLEKHYVDLKLEAARERAKIQAAEAFKKSIENGTFDSSSEHSLSILKAKQLELTQFKLGLCQLRKTVFSNIEKLSKFHNSTLIIHGDYEAKIRNQNVLLKKADKIIYYLATQKSYWQFLDYAFLNARHFFEKLHNLETEVTNQLDHMMADHQKRRNAMKAMHNLINSNDEDKCRFSPKAQQSIQTAYEDGSSSESKWKALNDFIGKTETQLQEMYSEAWRNFSEDGSLVPIPPIAKEHFGKLRVALQTLQKAAIEVIKSEAEMEKRLNADPELKESRELYVKFYTDPKTLK